MGGTLTSGGVRVSQSFQQLFNVSTDGSGLPTINGYTTLQKFGTSNATSWTMNVSTPGDGSIQIQMGTGSTQAITKISARITFETNNN